MYDKVIPSLEKHFGKGKDPAKRRALYVKLWKAVCTHGEPAFVCLKTVAHEALEKEISERYFCRAALRRFQEAGYMPQLDLDK